MRQFLIIGMIALMQIAQAETICDAKIALADARLNLMMMVMSTDNVEQKFLKKEIDKASLTLENELNNLLKEQNKSNDTQVMIFKKTWATFKYTRENGIIPAIRAGNNNKAFKIAIGIQSKRMRIMNNIIKTLDGDNCN